MRYTGSNRSMALSGSEFPKDGQQLKGIVSSGRERVGGDGHSLFPGAFNVSDGGEADPLSEFCSLGQTRAKRSRLEGFCKSCTQ
ncbi:hypothetical protein I7I50_04692 [Histoplasma capsulatum G186AR]|uniref:Uncharacterized protein n=1 Tax=Ajellomyces capsulatus TaxID=5037 RepID=A0A8H8CY66_AJECA|nr:hypothetical protein I7I52_05601 [Histoplasma capsulatum]QSS75530.1 hypothetical protein I7I50_04692 [Histoplasma capsulatum G186AR]